MNFHAECPGVFTRNFSANRFAVFVVAAIDTRAYYNDEPLLLRSIQPGFAENLTRAPRIYIDDYEIPVVMSEPENLQEAITNAVAGATAMAETLASMNAEDFQSPGDLSCPPNDENYGTDENNVTFNIVGPGSELVQEITTDLNSRETSSCSEYQADDLIGSFLNDIPEMPRNVSDVDMSVVCSMPEGYLKEKLLVVTKGTSETIEEYQSYLDTINTNMDTLSGDLWAKIGQDPGTIPVDFQDWLANTIEDTQLTTTTPMDQYYGIPLIELDAGREGDGSDSIILQVDSKNGWKLNLVNFGSLFNDDTKLEIDTEPIYAGTKFIAGFITDGVRHTLVQQILAPGHEIHSKTIVKPHNFTINSFGCDTRQIKNLCGVIHDIYVWDWAVPEDVTKLADNNLQPPYPFGALAFYDFNHARVIYNLVHERRGFLSPVRIGGTKGHDWNLFSDDISKTWKFMQNGYLEDFFCRRKFLKSSFSIVWHHQIEKNGSGRQYLISDDINNNYLYYDFMNMEFILKFNGVTERWAFYMPPKKWLQYSLRYNQVTGEIFIGCIDFESGNYYGSSFNIGTDLIFELMSMLARYEIRTKTYRDKFNCSFGMLMLFDDFRSEAFLNKYFLEEKIVIEELVPYK